MRTHLRLAAMLLSFLAASLEASEFSVGDTIDLALPDGLPSFSLSIVAAPPAGIAGQSYIARDAHSQASAVVKPTKDGLRVTIDDFENQKIYSVRVKDGVIEASVRDTSGCEGDVCGTCGGDIAVPPQEATPAETNAAPAATTRTSRLKSGCGVRATRSLSPSKRPSSTSLSPSTKARRRGVRHWDSTALTISPTTL